MHDWVMSCMIDSCHTCVVVSHMNETCHIWMSHVTPEWVESRMSHVTYVWDMSRVNTSCHTCEWVMSYLSESSDTLVGRVRREWLTRIFIMSNMRRHNTSPKKTLEFWGLGSDTNASRHPVQSCHVRASHAAHGWVTAYISDSSHQHPNEPCHEREV